MPGFFTTSATRLLRAGESIPYDLLLLADETIEAIDRYIHASDIHVLEQENKIIAVYVLYPLSEAEVEIKNIAVKDEYQNHGIGKFLLKDAAERAKTKGYEMMTIGTPDVSVKQLSIYEKAGFERYAIKKDFFILNYPEPIFEDGMQLKDMAMLRKRIK